MNSILHFFKSILLRDRFTILTTLAKLIYPEYRFTWNQLLWWKDDSFNNYLSRFEEQNGRNSQRRFMVYQLLRLTENITGDTAECGVYRGADSYLICKSNESSIISKYHYLFDSFEGVSEPEKDVDGDYWKKGVLSCDELSVANNLKDFKGKFSLMKGWIPSKFDEVKNIKFSFVHIDVDLYQPTLDSIAFFYPRMTIGGIIICDDYAFESCPGATKAIDEFLKDKPEKMVSLDSGGGFIIKGTKTNINYL